ncbi:hypothetical protein CWC05_18275 [Pseudoalteromonas ruthenica]|uniref:Uncharacterized protein n=1 Tax=Pseudoalteromonas ruthenica TaxID=151081 RepID=A0A5S3Z001_9GAMM|nr:hypothetical protein [Pseudoalteromonas ruthenica]TMP85488.1 hypothetical protein CWC05_18275 [Pseudoalteromonas ruthenica]
MKLNEDDFDLELMDSMVRESIKSHIEASDKDVLTNYILDSYEQDSRLYAKLKEWVEKIPKEYVEYLGIGHNWESKNVIEWLDMFIKLAQRASELNDVDVCALADMETAQPDAYKHVLSYRKKWASHRLGHCSPPKSFFFE